MLQRDTKQVVKSQERQQGTPTNTVDNSNRRDLSRVVIVVRADFAAPCSKYSYHARMTTRVSEMRTQLKHCISKWLPSGVPVALMDFPAYSNVGDSAIWWGQHQLISALGNKVAVSVDRYSYDPRQFRRRFREGVILLPGGGNFGDLWKDHQMFREHVLRNYRDYPIVQMPQSLHFDSQAALDSAAAAVRRHPQITLLWRDAGSCERASETFDAPSELSPDAAIALTGLNRTRPTKDVLWLDRKDQERLPGAMPLSLPGSVLVTDWLADDPPPELKKNNWHIRFRLQRFLKENRTLFQPMMRILSPLTSRYHLRAAQQNVIRGCQLLSQGRVVVTNRLHGHILCLLLDIPHVVLDNSTGKLSAFIETWESIPREYVARTPADAFRIAQDLKGEEQDE